MAYLLVALFIFLSVYKNIDIDKIKKDARRSDFFTKENVLSRTLEEKLNVKVSRKAKLELLGERAGVEISYYTFMAYRLILAFIGFISLLIFLRSIPFAIAFAILLYVLPKEVIGYLANKRMNRLEKQIGITMRGITTRYQSTGDIMESLVGTMHDFEGEYPIYDELKRVTDEIALGETSEDALEGMARRVGNKFFTRFVVFYKVAAEAGTIDARKALLGDAIKQYEEDHKIKLSLKKSLREPKFSVYFMICLIPVMALLGSSTTENYWTFMTQSFSGQVVSIIVIAIIVISLWLVNSKLAAPLDKDEVKDWGDN